MPNVEYVAAAEVLGVVLIAMLSAALLRATTLHGRRATTLHVDLRSDAGIVLLALIAAAAVSIAVLQ
jgi:hypothetical protein